MCNYPPYLAYWKFSRILKCSVIKNFKLSDYAKNLSSEAKKWYKSKLSETFSEVDPYIDGVFEYSADLPGVTYEQIYDFWWTAFIPQTKSKMLLKVWTLIVLCVQRVG